MIRKRITALCIAIAMTVTLTACGGGESSSTEGSGAFPGTPEADMVTLNIVSEPMDLNPMRLKDNISQSILAHCMAGFTRLDENDKPVADLAEKWEINEADTVYTMHLKKDAKWSNGEPVTVRDFYYAWVRQMKPETGSTFAGFLCDNIENGNAFYNGEVTEEALGIEVLDDYTMEIHWSHPMAEANGLFYLSQPFYLPVNQKAYEQIGDTQYAKDAEKMLTNGPYKITEWVHDDHMILEKSENYHDAARMSIPKAKLVMIDDANTGMNAFMAGEVDMCNIYSEQIAQLKEKSKSAVQSFEDGGTWYLNFNTKAQELSNVNLRKALAYSIDVQSLLDNVINDGSVTADGLVPDAIMGADGQNYSEERGSLFQFDKAEAVNYLNAALAELGKTKEEIKLVLWSTDSAYNQTQSAYLQQQWKENLGLDVQLKLMAVKAVTEAQYNGEYSFLVDGWGPTENDPITFLENYQTDSLNNTGQYSNSRYDELIKNAVKEGDSLKRQALLMEAEKILIDDMVIGPMYFTRTTYALSEKLEGLVRTPFQFFNLRYAKIITQ